VNPDPEAQEKFKEINAAYEVLSDPAKREIVNLGGDPLAPGQGAGASAGPFVGFQDIMDAFFGGGATARGPRPRTRPGADAILRLELDLHETAFGVEAPISVDTAVVCQTCNGAGTAAGTHPTTCETCHGRGEIQSVQRTFLGQVVSARPCPSCQGYGSIITHPCAKCGGDGRVRARRNLTVKIPAGVEDGMRIRLANQGEVGPGGGPAGDLYVEIQERPHDIFSRKGDDLHCRVTVPMTAAALGTRITIKALDSEETVDVKPGTQPGSSLRIRGKGVPHLRGTGRGDLHVHLDVRTPTKLSSEEERMLRDFARTRGEEVAELSRQKGGFLSFMRDAFNGQA
jgi:molecular chaperone DnaJ